MVFVCVMYVLYGRWAVSSTKREKTLKTLGFLVRDTCVQEFAIATPKCSQNATDWATLRHSPLLRAAAVRCTALEIAADFAAVGGARSRNRTGTPVRARDFKSLVSTYFTIRASVCC